MTKLFPQSEAPDEPSPLEPHNPVANEESVGVIL